MTFIANLVEDLVGVFREPFLFAWPDGKESFLAFYCTYRNAANESLFRASIAELRRQLSSRPKTNHQTRRNNSQSEKKER